MPSHLAVATARRAAGRGSNVGGAPVHSPRPARMHPAGGRPSVESPNRY